MNIEIHFDYGQAHELENIESYTFDDKFGVFNFFRENGEYKKMLYNIDSIKYIKIEGKISE